MQNFWTDTEPGAIADLNRLFESIAPRHEDYRHHLRWGDDNGSSHVRAALLGPSLTIPFADAQLIVGTWQQMREYFVHRSLYHLKEGDPHAWAIPRLVGQAKASFVAVEFDEYGGGRPDRVHARLFADAMEALGLDALVHGVRYPDDALAALAEAGIAYRGWLPNHLVPLAFARARVTVHVPRRPYVEALPGIPTIRVFEYNTIPGFGPAVDVVEATGLADQGFDPVGYQDVPGLSVGGKTGTGEKYDPSIRGYNHQRQVSSFAAVFPTDGPLEADRYFVLILLDEPHGNAHTFGFSTGGWVAAPTAGRVIDRIAPFLGVQRRTDILALAPPPPREEPAG